MIGGGAAVTPPPSVVWVDGVISNLQVPAGAMGVSADGSVITGTGFVGPDFGAFRWEATPGCNPEIPGNTCATLLDFGRAGGISDDGAVIGGSSAFPRIAVHWEAGVTTVLGHMTGSEGVFTRSEVSAVSGDGSTLVGGAEIIEGVRFEAFRSITREGCTTFPAVENPCMESLGVLFEGPGSFDFSAALGVSEDGSVIVGSSDGGPFRWTEAEGLVRLGRVGVGGRTLGGRATSADGSVIVGGSFRNFREDGSNLAFIWTEADGLRRLRDVLILDFGLNLSGWTLDTANGISADGNVIVGTGTNPAGETEAWIVDLSPVAPFAVIEPGTLLMSALNVENPSDPLTELIVIDPVTGEWRVVLSTPRAELDVFSVAVRADGRVFLSARGAPGTPGSIVEFLPDSGELRTVANDDAGPIAIGPGGNLVSAGEFLGLRIVDVETGAGHDLGFFDAEAVVSQPHGPIFVRTFADVLAIDPTTGVVSDATPGVGAPFASPALLAIGPDARMYLQGTGIFGVPILTIDRGIVSQLTSFAFGGFARALTVGPMGRLHVGLAAIDPPNPPIQQILSIDTTTGESDVLVEFPNRVIFALAAVPGFALAQCIEDLGAALDQLADGDDDGEPDSNDRCPETPLGAPVDDSGCSQDQFCRAVGESGRWGIARCLASDWRNDEPTRFLPRACRLDRSGRAKFDCVAR